jgi:hypothetical protein
MDRLECETGKGSSYLMAWTGFTFAKGTAFVVFEGRGVGRGGRVGSSRKVVQGEQRGCSVEAN